MHCVFSTKERRPWLCGGLPQSKTPARNPTRQISPHFFPARQHLPTCAPARATFSYLTPGGFRKSLISAFFPAGIIVA
jgi:hypothetical protein